MLNYSWSGLFFLLWSSISLAATILPAEQVFHSTVFLVNEHVANLQIQIAPGYFLYKNSIQLKRNHDIFKLQFPLPHQRMHFGRRQDVYANTILIPFTYSVTPSQSTIDGLILRYQGCSQEGFCYPPLHQKLSVAPLIHNEHILQSSYQKLHRLLTDQNYVTDFLNFQNIWLIWVVFLSGGILLSLTPCIWPLFPILLGIIGQSKKNPQQVFYLSCVYVMGSTLTYTAAGLLTAWLGRSLQVYLQQAWINWLFALVLASLALAMWGQFNLPRIFTFTPWQSLNSGRYSVFIMGVTSALIISPCVTAPLIGILLYIAKTGDYVLGGSVLFMVGFGMGIPLIIMGATAGKYLPKSGRWMIVIQRMLAVIMLGVAAWLVLRNMSWYNDNINDTKTIQGQVTAKASFLNVRNLAEIRAALLTAKSRHQLAMLDFYASWCDSCRVLEQEIFTNLRITQQLNRFMLIRVDLSPNGKVEEEMLKYFQVIAPPSLLFFAADGRELKNQRIVGEISQVEFLQRIGSI